MTFKKIIQEYSITLRGNNLETSLKEFEKIIDIDYNNRLKFKNKDYLMKIKDDEFAKILNKQKNDYLNIRR